MTITLLIVASILFAILIYTGRGYWAWVSAAALILASWLSSGVASPGLFFAAAAAVAVAAAVFGLPPVRRTLITARVMRLMARILPRMGDTERMALEAGTVWWDGEMFSGAPDWKKLFDFELQPLSEDEQAFLDGPVEELCGMLDDWQIAQDYDLPEEVWDFLKRKRFFGMIIPRKYGGLGFSAIGHSSVVTKVSSRSVAACSCAPCTSRPEPAPAASRWCCPTTWPKFRC